MRNVAYEPEVFSGLCGHGAVLHQGGCGKHSSFYREMLQRGLQPGHGIYDLDILKPMHEWRPEETGYTVISADDLKQMDRFDGEDMENER